MTDDDKALVERLREADDWYFDEPWERTTLVSDAPFKAADRIEAQAAEIERLRDIPYRIWAEARDSEWDEGFNYAVKLFRAALGESHD